MEEFPSVDGKVEIEPVNESFVQKIRKVGLGKALSFFAGFVLLLTMSYLVSTKVTPSGKSKAANPTVNLLLKLTKDPTTKEITVGNALVNNGFPSYYPKIDYKNQDTLNQVVNGGVTLSVPILFSNIEYKDSLTAEKLTGGLAEGVKEEAFVAMPYDPTSTLQIVMNPKNLKGTTQGTDPVSITKTVSDPNNYIGAAVLAFKTNSPQAMSISNTQSTVTTTINNQAVALPASVTATSNPDGYLDLAFVSVYYGPTEQDAFNSAVDETVGYLKQSEVFRDYADKIRVTKIFNNADTLGCTNDDTDGYYTCNPFLVLAYASLFGPFDRVVVLRNSTLDGAIANLAFGLTCLNGGSQWSKRSITHELGHTIGGLVDEYTIQPPRTANVMDIINFSGPNCSTLDFWTHKCKWEPNPAVCIKECGPIDWYRSVDNGMMNRGDYTDSWGTLDESLMRTAINALIAGYFFPITPVPSPGNPPAGVMWCGNCNNYTCVLGTPDQCAQVGDTDGDGNCSGQCGPAEPTSTPIPTPQPCDPNSISMSAAPNTTNQTMNFKIAGDASTMLSDISTPSAILGAGNFSLCAGPWNSKVCPVVTTGKGTWTHTWQQCAMGGSGQIVCNSKKCSKSTPYDTGAMTLTQRPECGVGGVTLSFVPDVAKQTVTFKIAGDASTNIHDISAPSEILGAGDFSKCTGTWNNKVCPVTTMGSGIWMHTWQKCFTDSTGKVVCDNSYTCSKSIQYNTGSMISAQVGLGSDSASLKYSFTNYNTNKAYRLASFSLGFQPNKPGSIPNMTVNNISWGTVANLIWNTPKAITDSSGNPVSFQLGLSDWKSGADTWLPAKPVQLTPTPGPKTFQMSFNNKLTNSGEYPATFVFDDGINGSNQVTVWATYSALPPILASKTLVTFSGPNPRTSAFQNKYFWTTNVPVYSYQIATSPRTEPWWTTVNAEYRDFFASENINWWSVIADRNGGINGYADVDMQLNTKGQTDYENFSNYNKLRMKFISVNNYNPNSNLQIFIQTRVSNKWYHLGYISYKSGEVLTKDFDLTSVLTADLAKIDLIKFRIFNKYIPPGNDNNRLQRFHLYNIQLIKQ